MKAETVHTAVHFQPESGPCIQTLQPRQLLETMEHRLKATPGAFSDIRFSMDALKQDDRLCQTCFPNGTRFFQASHCVFRHQAIQRRSHRPDTVAIAIGFHHGHHTGPACPPLGSLEVPAQGVQINPGNRTAGHQYSPP